MEQTAEEETMEKNDMKNYLESQEALADQLKKKLHEHKQQITSKETILAEMKTLHARALEKRNAELEQINLERTLITDMEKSILEEAEKNDTLSNLVKNQEYVIGDLEKQVDDYKVKIEEKEDALNETKVEYTKKLEDKEAVNEDLAKQLNENKVTVAQQANRMSEVNIDHQQALKRLQCDIGDLEKQVDDYKVRIEEKEDALNETKVEYTKELEDKETVNEELAKQLNENKVTVAQQANRMSEVNIHHQQALKRLQCDLDQVTLAKAVCITDLEKSLEQENEKKGALNNYVEDQKTVIDELERKMNEYKKKMEEKDALLKEKEEEYTKEVKTLKGLNKEYLKQLNEKMGVIVQQENRMNETNARHTQALENLQCELEQTTLDKTANINDLEESLAEENEKKNMLNNHVENQKGVIGDMERQINEYKLNVSGKEKLLNEKEEEYAEKLEAQEAANEDLVKQLDENKATIAQQEVNMIELDAQHTEALERLQTDLERIASDKSTYITDMEKSVAEKSEEKDMLNNFVESQKVLINNLQRQVDDFKLKVKDKEEQLHRKEEEYTKKLETEEAVIEAQLKQISENTGTIAQQENHLIEISAKHTQALEKLQHDLEQIVLKKMSCISDMENKLEEETKKKDALTNTVNSQQTVIADLERQINEYRDKVALREKQLVEEKEENTREMETLEAVNEKNLLKLKENKATIGQLENLLIEVDAQRKVELEKLANNLEQVISEKTAHITDMEKSFDEETEKKGVLTSFVKTQEAVIRDLKRQISEYKDKVNEQEQLLDETREEYANKLEVKEADIEEHLKQLDEHNGTIAQQEIDLIEKDIEHTRALEKLQSDLEQVATDKTAYIIEMEKSLKKETEMKIQLNNFVENQKSVNGNLARQINEYKTKVAAQERQINESKVKVAAQEQLLNKTKSEYLKEAKAQKAVNVQYLKQLNEHEVTMTQQENHLLKMDAQHTKEVEKLQYEVQKLEHEKRALIETVKKLEENLLKMDYETKRKREELNQLQKSQQQLQLDHINEIRNLNNEHRKQLGTLIELPEKDKNIKSLLLNLQKEADEVLDLMINVPEVTENHIVAKERSFVEMSPRTNDNLSTEGIEDFLHDQMGDMSIGSMASALQADIDQNNNNNNNNKLEAKRLEFQPDRSADHLVNEHPFLHDNRVLSEFEKLLTEESNRAEVLTMKLEEEARRRENILISHQGELRKIVDRELKLKDKYLKVAELLQKEKNAKTRLLGMLNDAQRLNELQAKNLEEVQNDKNSLLESYAIVTELENLLTEEKEKRDLINAKLAKERYEKLTMQTSLAEEKSELQATKAREIGLKESCRELKKLLESEAGERKNIADTLQYEKSMITMEKKNLEQKQFALNQKLAGIGNENLADKITALKAWETEVKKREKFVAGKEVKVKNLIGRIEKGYDILPQKEVKDGVSEETDLMKRIQNEQLDTKHLPLVADLNQKITTLQREKSILADDVNVLTKEIVEYKKQLKEYKSNAEDKEPKLCDPSISSSQDSVTTDGQKLINAGWTIAKVQRLYLKYFRAESFRKALIYQKRYLAMVLNNEKDRSQLGNVYNLLKPRKRKLTFKAAVFTVIAIQRMKYLVQKYHRQLYKSSPEYPYKDKIRNISKKLSLDNGSDDEHQSLSTSERKDIAPKHSVNSLSKSNPSKPLPTNSPSKGYPRQRQSNLVSLSTRLAASEPAINRLHLSNRSLERSIDWLNRNDVSTGMYFGGSYLNNMNRSLNEDQLRRLSTFPAKSMSGISGVPRSYPRSPGIVDEFPSKLSSTNGNLSLSNPRLDKSPVRPFAATSSPLKTSTYRDSNRDMNESKDKANESLSSYIEGLEALHNRLKTVGYNDQVKPSLL